MQPKLPLNTGLLYECLNDDCFYVGALVNFEDVTWKNVWNSEIGDLDFVPCCASCAEFVAVWEGADDG